MQWDAMGWDGMKCNGMQWDAMGTAYAWVAMGEWVGGHRWVDEWVGGWVGRWGRGRGNSEAKGKANVCGKSVWNGSSKGRKRP